MSHPLKINNSFFGHRLVLYKARVLKPDGKNAQTCTFQTVVCLVGLEDKFSVVFTAIALKVF